MFFTIEENHSADAGSYGGMKGVVYGQEVEATYANSKQNSILVSGEEFVRIGGCEKAFNPNYLYLWGDFKEV